MVEHGLEPERRKSGCFEEPHVKFPHGEEEHVKGEG